MIFVTVGNATQPFPRLLSAVAELARAGELSDEPLLIQFGHGKPVTAPKTTWTPFLPVGVFEQTIADASLIITHGGCGTLLTAIRRGKVPVVMPRRKKNGEHVNDHQLQLTQALAADAYIVPALEPQDLAGAIRAARTQATRPSLATSPPLVDLVADALTRLLDARGQGL